MVFIWSSGGRRRRRGTARATADGPATATARATATGAATAAAASSCLRDLLLLDVGCCPAEMPRLRHERFPARADDGPAVHDAGTAPHASLADRMIAAVRVYQREISPKRAPVCRFTPTCSAYAVQALEQHGAGRGSWLTLRRLVRCRPGAAGGADPVPA